VAGSIVVSYYQQWKKNFFFQKMFGVFKSLKIFYVSKKWDPIFEMHWWKPLITPFHAFAEWITTSLLENYDSNMKLNVYCIINCNTKKYNLNLLRFSRTSCQSLVITAISNWSLWCINGQKAIILISDGHNKLWKVYFSCDITPRVLWNW